MTTGGTPDAKPAGALDGLHTGELAIELDQSTPGGPLRLVWRGRSTERNPSLVLTPFFQRAIDAAAERGSAIEMRFEALDHFNSSTITAIIQLIQDARRRGTRLVVVYDGSVKWQKLSFEALAVFDKGDGLLELRSGGARA